MKKIEQFYITELTLAGFKNYLEPATFVFGNPTVITGGNGQGKSTLADAVAFAVTGLPFFGERGIDRLYNDAMKQQMELSVRLRFVDQDGAAHELYRLRKNSRMVITYDGYDIRQTDLTDMFGERDVFLSIFRYLNGCTLGKIKRELEEDGVPTAQGVERWSPSIIHNILTNEKYIGDALLQKTYVTDCINKKVKKNRGERTMYYVENSHPAIVSRDLFNQVQQEMTRRSSKRKVLQKSGKTELGKYSGKYALTELLVCGECGSPYKRVTWARNGEKRIVWRCVSRLEFGTKYCQHSPTLDEGRLHSAILAAMNEYAAIRQEVCPDVLAMAEEAKQALSQAGARLLQLKKRMDAVSREQSDVLDRLLVNMADTELNARMKALTDEKESLKAQIADAQQAEVNLEEQAARRRQMWDSIMECAAGYTEFDNELVRQVIQKITVEDAETIHIHFRDSDVVLEQEVE